MNCTLALLHTNAANMFVFVWSVVKSCNIYMYASTTTPLTKCNLARTPKETREELGGFFYCICTMKTYETSSPSLLFWAQRKDARKVERK